MRSGDGLAFDLQQRKAKKVSSDQLHKELIKRYNMEKVMPYEVETELPSTKEKVPLVCFDCEAQTADLLTDPRLCKDHYLFPNNHPAGNPPEEFNFVSDLISGRAYRETHKALIEPMPKTSCGRIRVLNPYVLYLDGCVTGQFQNQEIEILKFTLGLLNRRARRQAWAWRELGFVHKSVKGHSEGKRMIAESDHVDAPNHVMDASYRGKKYCQLVGDMPEFDSKKYNKRNRRGNNTPTMPTSKAQDLHKMLQVMLASYSDMEKAGGMDWDLPWEGEILKVRLVPFIIVCKLDGKEGDKLAGQHTA